MNSVAKTDWLQRIREIKVDRSHGLGPALKKPLLLLLLVSRYAKGEIKKNEFRFADIEADLAELIVQFGGKPTDSGPKSEQPFFYLKSDGFWILHLPAKAPEAARGRPVISVLRDPNCFAQLDSGLHGKLSEPQFRAQLAEEILRQWWPETIQEDLIERLALECRSVVPGEGRRELVRSAEFRIRVLRNYRHKCTLCGFTAMLNGQPFGLEAAHIRALQFGGADKVDNGISLCRIHHVLFDRGAVGIDQQRRILLSERLTIQEDDLFMTVARSKGKQIAAAVSEEPRQEFFDWHRREVFLG